MPSTMSFAGRIARINNENEMPLDVPASRLGKRLLSRDADDSEHTEKRPRYTKSHSNTTTGGPRRPALGDVTSRRAALGDITSQRAAFGDITSRRAALGVVTSRRAALGDMTNRINIKKESMSSMSSSISNVGALAKKKVIASKRNSSNVNASSRSLSNTNANKRSFNNVTLGSRHVNATTSCTAMLDSRTSSSITSRMSCPLSPTTPVDSTCGSVGPMGKTSPMVDIIPPIPEENDHNIDAEDKNDPAACWQYAEDITNYYLEVEKKSKPSSSYMTRQSDINSKMRSILVDWLVDVHYKYDLLPQTLHIAVLLIDHYLEKNLTIERQRLQLVGISAMMIAAKYEEIYPPEAADFVKITDNAYTRKELIQMESKMLSTLDYRVTFPTAFQFMKRFLKASRTCDDRVEHFAHYAIDRSLQEYKLTKYLPSTIAASAVRIARTQMRDVPAWSSTLEYHTSYSERSLDPCVEDMTEMLWSTYKGVGKMAKLTAARRKFSKERFMRVATEPLELGKSAQ